MYRPTKQLVWALSVIGVVCGVRSLHAEQVVFALDPAKSVLELSGTFAGFDIVPQGDDDTSLVTNYDGIFTVDVDNPADPSTIAFVSAELFALNSGDWLPEAGGGDMGDPGTPEPANYGMFVTSILGDAWGTFRDLEYNIFSEPGDSDAVTNGRFAPNHKFVTTVGILDSALQTIQGDESDSDSVAGEEAFNDGADGRYTVSGGTATIELDVDLTFPGDLFVNMTGLLVATASVGGVHGDLDGDGAIGIGDFDEMARALRENLTDAQYDLDGSGAVDGADYAFLIVDIANSFAGDSNFDLMFDSDDLIEAFSAGEYNDEIAGNSTWQEGDWDGNGDFDSDDLIFAFSEGGYNTGPRVAASAVPEPTGGLMLWIAVATLGMLGRRKP